MFRRPESLRERTLLRIIDRQDRRIDELTNMLMHLAGRTWGLPEQPIVADEPEPDGDGFVSVLHGLPPDMED